MPKKAPDRRKGREDVSVDQRQGRDRREHERIMVDLEVDYGADDTFLFAYITDISAMGIFILTSNPEPPGTRLNLRFCAPKEVGGKLIELEGEVIWINPPRPHDPTGRNPGMGIKFVDMSPAQREDILRLVRTFAYLDEDTDDEPPIGNS